MKALINKVRKPIYQFDLHGNFIQEFESIRTAAKAVNGDSTPIREVLKGNRVSAYGYAWRLKYGC